MRSNITEKRIEAQNILARSDMSDDLKLHEVFQIYKEDLQREYSQIYYALLAWRDTHLSELYKERSNHIKEFSHQESPNENYFEELNDYLDGTMAL